MESCKLTGKRLGKVASFLVRDSEFSRVSEKTATCNSGKAEGSPVICTPDKARIDKTEKIRKKDNTFRILCRDLKN